MPQITTYYDNLFDCFQTLVHIDFTILRFNISVTANAKRSTIAGAISHQNQLTAVIEPTAITLNTSHIMSVESG